MPFSIEDFRDLVRLVEERPEWRAELRRLVLTDELLALPHQVAQLTAQVGLLVEAQRHTDERIAELTEAQRRTDERLAQLTAQVGVLTEAQRRTDERIAELTEAQRRMAEQLASLTVQVTSLTQTVSMLVDVVGELKGGMLELRYRANAASYLRQIVRRLHTLSSDELAALLDDAVEQGKLAEAESDEILRADLVVRGRRREDGAPVYLVVEISAGVGSSDVERAARRAELLSKLGTVALPVVAGNTITEAAAHLARSRQVWQVTDGRAVAPEPASSSPAA